MMLNADKTPLTAYSGLTEKSITRLPHIRGNILQTQRKVIYYAITLKQKMTIIDDNVNFFSGHGLCCHGTTMLMDRSLEKQSRYQANTIRT